jgi:hypothetical protein
MPSVIYAECRKQTHYAEFSYAECLYAECRSANKTNISSYHGLQRWHSGGTIARNPKVGGSSPGLYHKNITAVIYLFQ